MIERLKSEEFVELLRETFDRGQELTFTPSGRSMMPMLDGKDDKVTLSPKPERLKKYDCAFYLRPRTRQPVLHRMIGFTKNGGYIFSGDNQYVKEYGIADADILAVVTGFTHKRKERSLHSLRYRLYCIRIVFRKKPVALLARIYHRLKGTNT